MTLPTIPPWARAASLYTFGAHPSKRNFGSKDSIDEQTDVDAEELKRIGSHLAAHDKTVPLGFLHFTCDDTGTNDPTVHVVQAQFGERYADYDGGSPPTGMPTVVRESDGVVLITFAATYNDEYGNAGTFAVKHCMPSVEGTSAANAVYELVSDVSIRLRITDDAAAAATDQVVHVEFS